MLIYESEDPKDCGGDHHLMMTTARRIRGYGLMFISINEVEQVILEKVCDEIFGNQQH